MSIFNMIIEQAILQTLAFLDSMLRLQFDPWSQRILLILNKSVLIPNILIINAILIVFKVFKTGNFILFILEPFFFFFFVIFLNGFHFNKIK